MQFCDFYGISNAKSISTLVKTHKYDNLYSTRVGSKCLGVELEGTGHMPCGAASVEGVELNKFNSF